jgi:Ni,Fe-hydrogenase III large subunit/Ni,Fe-hydrogenase III component G
VTAPRELARPAGEHAPARQTIELPAHELHAAAGALLADGFRLALVSAVDGPGPLRAVYLFATGPPDRRVELVVRLDRGRPEVPTLADLSFPASRFEREMRDLFGIEAVGHPFARRLVLHQHWPAAWHPMRRDAGPAPAMVDDAGPYPFVEMRGTGTYEIPVGPVHAGLIEPGHFRFSVVGETILKMTARLWFVHKGIEKLFEGRDVHAGLELAEKISGDTAVGHGLAYCLAVEEACGADVPARAHELRMVLLELERIYNHVADIGALCNDVGFGIVHARALTLRERLLRLNARVTGHRLLRGGVRLGGARVTSLPSDAELAAIGEEFHDLVELALGQSIVLDRFTGTAVLPLEDVDALGVVGVVARASGSGLDARVAHPVREPAIAGFEPACATTGDVLARFMIRVAEVDASLAVLADLVTRPGPLRSDGSLRRLGSTGSGIAEGWRGAITHRVEVDEAGRLARVKVVDPSFFNWPALAIALKDTIVPDFPLANKSFNLSYAGNDL